MSLILDVPAEVERERTVSAVRSTPLHTSVSPETRFKRDRAGYKRLHQKALLADAESRKEAAIRPDAGRDRTTYAMQKGLLITSDVLMQRLIRLNPSLWFEVANANHEMIGIYIPDARVQPEGMRYITCFHRGPVPEFTVLKKDTDNECTGIFRNGWRTVLAKLIRERLISKHRADIIFGPPYKDSEYWAVLTGGRSSYGN